jgi:hypothetical protein
MTDELTDKQCLDCDVPVHEGPSGSYLNEDGTYHVCKEQDSQG